MDNSIILNLEKEFKEDLFEFHKPFEDVFNKWVSNDVWTIINKCKETYLAEKSRDLLFLIDYLISYWIKINMLTDEKNNELLIEIYDELYKNSFDVPKNLWILVNFMEKLNLDVSDKIKKKISLLITLDETTNTQKLVKYIENIDLDEEKFLLKIKKILLDYPQLGTLIINQINDYFKTDEKILRLRENSDLNFLIIQCFKDCFELDNFNLHDDINLKNRSNFFLICNFLNVLPDKEIIDNDKLDFYFEKVIDECQLLNNENMPHLIERFYSSILGRDTGYLGSKLSKLFWTKIKKQNKNQISLILEKKDSTLNILNCFYLILFEKKSLVLEFLNFDLNDFNLIPDKMKFFFLVYKVYNIKSIKDQFEYNSQCEKFENLINDDKMLLKNSTFLDKVDEYLFFKLKWIFKTINWILIKCDLVDDKKALTENLHSKLLIDFLNGTSVLKLLLKYDFLIKLDENNESFCQDILELIVECENKTELMLWKGFIVTRLAMIWLINGKTDEEDINEIPRQIRTYIKKILPLNFRTELLENLFSLLFLNQNDLLNLKEIEKSISEKSSLNHEELTMNQSKKNIENLLNDNNFESLSFKNDSINNDDHQNGSFKKNFSFFQTSDNFLFPNELVYEFINLLKDCTLQTQNTLTKFNSKLNEDELKKLETEFNIDCSIKNLKETKIHLDNLIEHLNFAELRFSLLEPAFFKTDKNNSDNKFNSRNEFFTQNKTNASLSSFSCDTLSTNEQSDLLNDFSNDEDIEFEGMNYLSNNFQKRKSSLNLDYLKSQKINTFAENYQQNFNYGITHSIISCMLAPHDQLLRFCLIEDHLEKAKQIYKIFSKDLESTIEATELFILEKWNKLEIKTYEIFCTEGRFNKNNEKNLNLSAKLYDFLNMFLRNDLMSSNFKFDKFSLLADFSITNASSIQVAKVFTSFALNQSFKDNRNNERVLKFMANFNNLLTVFEETNRYNNYSVSAILNECMEINIFDSPIKLNEELEKKQNLILCVNEIQNLLLMDGNFIDIFQEFSTQQNSLPNYNSTILTNSPQPKIDLRKLTSEYKKLLQLCSQKKFNYLKALFYYVQKVTKVLQECKKRSDQFGLPEQNNEKVKSSLNSLLKNSTSYFSVLYQSPSAILYSMVIKHKISPKYLDDLAKEMKVDLLSTLCNDLLPSIPSTIKQDDLYFEFSINDCSHPALTKLVSNHLSGNTIARQDSFLIQNHFEEDIDSNRSEMIYKYEVIKTLDLIEYFGSKSWILVKILNLLNLIDVNLVKKDLIGPDFIENSPIIRRITIFQHLFNENIISTKSSIDISILALLPCLTSGNLTVIKCLEKFAQNSNWQKMYNELLLIDLNDSHSNSSFNSLKTALLSKIALETGDVKYALQIKDSKKRVKLILDIIENQNFDLYFSSKIAIEDLNSLYSTLKQKDESDDEFMEIKKTVELAIKRVTVFRKIAELAGLRSWKDAIENLTDIDILTILKTRHTYKIVIEWNEIFKKYKYPINLSKKNKPNNINEDKKLFFETEELRKELLAIAYCEERNRESINELLKEHNSPINLLRRILDSIENLDCKEFIINLILEQKNKFDDLETQKLYSNQLLSIRMIKNLDEYKRPYYMPIINDPQLIFEQMLMNMEFSSLEKCVKMKMFFDLNDLIEIYAKKAVDIVLTKDSVSFSGSDTTMISSNYLKEGSVIFERSNSHLSNIRENSLINTSTNSNTTESFIMPLNIPTRNQWTPDDKVLYCMACKIERFSMFTRKHHCRRCGRVVCRNCSEKRMLIPKIHVQNPVRVCDQCFSQSNYEQFFQYQHSGSNISSSKSILRKESQSNFIAYPCNVEWILSLNQQENDLSRDEFFYEAAPSSSLCLSILKLHQEKKRCAQIILDFLCRPLFEILSSRDIDYGLVINIIKSLVNSAKVILNEESDCAGLNAQIDFLLDRIDIIKMLVEDNCLDYDLIHLLINNEMAFQKVQEKLIEMERFELALNISAKIGGANLKAIWKTWAMICIKNGKYAESYPKFKYCFQKKEDGSSQNSLLLNEIFDVFENQRVFVNFHSLKERCKLIKQGKFNNLINFDLTSNEKSDFNYLPSVLCKHAEYFLENYGSKEDYLRFYIKFKFFKKAIQLFLNEPSNSNFYSIFVNEFFLPSINNGTLDKILNKLYLVDPTLNKSWKYLIAVCKYLSANKFYSILHKIQLFMRDYIRASMTKINYFYLSPPPTDYVQLFHRNEHLMQAKEHCRQYIVNEPELNKGCLRVAKEHVLKQIHTINLQIEITSKFYENSVKGYLTNFVEEQQDSVYLNQQLNSDEISKKSELEFQEFVNKNVDKKEPLTLLTGSKTKKTYLAALVLIEASPSISDNFELAQQIIKDNDLNLNLVYRVAAKILINSKKSKILKLVEEFVECIKKSKKDDWPQVCDEFICVCIRHTNNSDLIDPMIKMLNNDENKINSYILTKKLKSAYLLAVKKERISDVKRILSVAESTKQDSIKSICERWLSKFK